MLWHDVFELCEFLSNYVCYFWDADIFFQNAYARNRITFDIPELFESLKIISCDYSVE